MSVLMGWAIGWGNCVGIGSVDAFGGARGSRIKEIDGLACCEPEGEGAFCCSWAAGGFSLELEGKDDDFCCC